MMWLGEVLREYVFVPCSYIFFHKLLIILIVLSLPFAMQPSSEGVFVSFPACTSAKGLHLPVYNSASSRGE